MSRLAIFSDWDCAVLAYRVWHTYDKTKSRQARSPATPTTTVRTIYVLNESNLPIKFSAAKLHCRFQRYMWNLPFRSCLFLGRNGRLPKHLQLMPSRQASFHSDRSVQ